MRERVAVVCLYDEEGVCVWGGVSWCNVLLLLMLFVSRVDGRASNVKKRLRMEEEGEERDKEKAQKKGKGGREEWAKEG